ncbi:20210_t:CDS:2, partial [Entrophospora sp. SA101]
ELDFILILIDQINLILENGLKKDLQEIINDLINQYDRYIFFSDKISDEDQSKSSSSNIVTIISGNNKRIIGSDGSHDDNKGHVKKIKIISNNSEEESVEGEEIYFKNEHVAVEVIIEDVGGG